MTTATDVVLVFYKFCAEHGGYAGYTLLRTMLEDVFDDLLIEHDNELKEAFKRALEEQRT